MSYFFAAAGPSSPVAQLTTRYGRPNPLTIDSCNARIASSSSPPIGMREAEHLRLVELVHTEDAAGVLPVRAGLAAEARREPGVAQGERVWVDDLTAMQRRERDLARPDEEQLAVVEDR